jgi:hypothetical protein
MPFGLVTKKYLEQHLAELREEFQSSAAFQDELRFEWARWYDKFRSLYLMLLKRDKKAAKEASGEANGDGEAPAPGEQPANSLGPSWRSRRGF